jgi:hypothetical protein
MGLGLLIAFPEFAARMILLMPAWCLYSGRRARQTLALVGVVLLSANAAAQPQAIQFNRDIRPILSNHCFQCHGPDKAKRKASLRLDMEEGIFADLGDCKVIVPGEPSKSELFRRITATDESERMPPAKAGGRLAERDVALIRRWIEQGAKWQKHWAFTKPKRPPVPTVKNASWVRNPIDAFVLARLEREGLSPSPEADRTILIRRATLDLTGLPPASAEVDAFLADSSPDAYEKVVDRLLRSPRYGERMAARWLDAARYADTNGYQNDGDRTMWRWRDWVIEAYNRNMPFDQFTIEQIAGDMLPHPTLEQRIATGFNRNHRLNAEGGIIPEEYAVEYVVDRVDTTATVWLGLTLACARCHDHKFDPITQREFYQVFAYFNNVPERGKAVKYGNSPPLIAAPTREQQARLVELQKELADADHEFATLREQIDAAQRAWEKSFSTATPLHWAPAAGLVADFAFDGDTKRGKPEGNLSFVEGPLGRAAAFDGRTFVDAGDVADFGFYDKFSIAAWVYPKGMEGGAILSRMDDTAMAEGYNLHLEKGKVQLNLSKRWLDDALRVETAAALAPERWHHVMATYDGSRWASGVRIYVDGEPQKLTVNLDELNQSFNTKQPLRIGSRGTRSRFHGSLTDVRIYNRALTPDEAQHLATPDAITSIIAQPPEKRTPRQAAKLRACFLENHAPEPIKQAHRRLLAARAAVEKHVESFPTTMVMEEMSPPRETHLLIRGQYDKHGEKVNAGVPASLWTPGANAPGSPSVPNNRLGFARWLVGPANPLTARVAINRYWQMYFGTGLVKTVDDFGAQGEWPLHAELLDWLATDFVRTGWDIKAVQRTIVTSATYRQSSRVTPALLQKDPENRLLARGPRFRLSAEMIRDQALAVSGLLVEKQGGPSVKPYQPPGLVKELTGTEDYVQDHGPNLYRRSLYTYFKRTVAPPTMMTFDAAGRETCVVRESRTNTPLQALALMNEVTFVEAARVLAERMMREGGRTPQERITFAFRLATARKPRPTELHILLDGFKEYRARYQTDERASQKLLSAGEHLRDTALPTRDLAAYTAVAGLILNLDETVTKE